MISITCFFCFAALWIQVADTGKKKVPPLMMAVYGEGESKQVTLTDSTVSKLNEFKLPLDNIQPTYIALLCRGNNSEEYQLEVKQVTDKIDSIDLEQKCLYHSRPYLKEEVESYVYYHYIGFEYKLSMPIPVKRSPSPLRKPKINDEVSTKFEGKYDIPTKQYASISNLKIKYYSYMMIPFSITHNVIAHMHSNESVKECDEIEIREGNTQVEKTHEELVKKFNFNNVQPPFQWRQLVPMGDFKGIYTTKTTCIYLNYILLHNEAFESLKIIEIFTRKVADVINRVEVVSGTYIKKYDNLIQKFDEKGNTIPTMVWRKIVYKSDGKQYAVLVVIHNQTTRRLCDKENDLGWPEHNSEENGETYTYRINERLAIGTMYVCLMNRRLSQEIYTQFDYSPFNLHEVHHNQEIINVLERIKANNSSSKTEQETPQQTKQLQKSPIQ